MSGVLSAGSFETELAARLSVLVKRGGEITSADVADCYKSVAASMGLKVSPADDLHIRDIYSIIVKLENQFAAADIRTIERKIFDMIYMH